MGRSVWTHGDAVETVYRTLNGLLSFCSECDIETDDAHECPDCGADMYDYTGDTQTDDYEYLVDWVRESFKQQFPSMQECDRWPERESRAIVENDHCMVVISEYCGLVSLGVVPLWADYWGDTIGLARYWTETHAARHLRDEFGDLVKVGTFSNGESVYERAS